MTSGTSAQAPSHAILRFAGCRASAYSLNLFPAGHTDMALNIELARHNMVEQQVRPWDVLDSRVLEALSSVPREEFVPAAHRALAFADIGLPLGHGEVMMKPVIEGRMLQAVAPAPTESVLEIGTGSGFLTACLA